MLRAQRGDTNNATMSPKTTQRTENNAKESRKAAISARTLKKRMRKNKQKSK